MTEQTMLTIVKSYQSLAYKYICTIYSISQYFKVTHDYIFPLNATVHHFVGRQGVCVGHQYCFLTAWNCTMVYLLNALPETSSNHHRPPPSSDLSKNLEILSFPSFRLLFCLPGRTRLSRRIRRDEKKLSTASSISRFFGNKKKEEPSKTVGGENYSERCIGVRMHIRARGGRGGDGFMSFHHFPASSKSNYFSPFPFYLGR